MKQLDKIEFLMGSRLIHFVFNDSEAMCRTFLKFQEFYESPEFKGKFFTLNEYIDWYKTTTDTGEFTYYDDWGGFNFPSRILKEFKSGGFFYDGLTPDELFIANVLNMIEGDFYVIASSGKINKRVFLHEKTHAIYYFNEEYRNEVNKVIDAFDKDFIKYSSNALTSRGYDDEFVYDEINAYFSTKDFLRFSMDDRGEKLAAKLYKLRLKYFKLY